jgi:hypothetical protein
MRFTVPTSLGVRDLDVACPEPLTNQGVPACRLRSGSNSSDLVQSPWPRHGWAAAAFGEVARRCDVLSFGSPVVEGGA